MDLKVYYRKIHEIERQLPEGDVLVVSCETPDGGKAGVISEVPRRLAAKLLVEGRARLAAEEEAKQFRDEQKAAAEQAREQAAVNQLKIAVVPESEWRRKTTKSEARSKRSD